ncbi:glycosyltransferase family 2 protein [bacterium]|nr:glycosyltransferase family 2 protein [bacterium]
MDMLSFLIVTYNSISTIDRCISSIYDHLGHLSLEVIVVDNGSSDGTAEYVKEHFPKVIIPDNTENTGFARGVNKAFRNSGGEILIILNPDTYLNDPSIENAVSYLVNNPDVGVLGPKISDNKGDFQYSCRRGKADPIMVLWKDLGLERILGRGFDEYKLHRISPDQILEVESVSGSCMILKSSLFRSLNGLDTRYFMYSEDIDLCLKVQKMGKKVMYFPETNVLHLGGVSSRQTPLRSLLYMHFSKLIFINRHYFRFPPYGLFLQLLVAARLLIKAYAALIRRNP